MKTTITSLIACWLVTVTSHAALVAHWTLDEGTGNTTTESVTSTVSGTFASGTSWSTDTPGPASTASISLNGSSGRIDTSVSSATIDINGTGAKTITAWIKTGASTNQAIFGYSPTNGITAGADLRFLVNNSGNLRFEANAGNFAVSSTTVNDNTWRMVALVIPADATTSGVSFYVDGSLASPGSSGGSATLNTSTGSQIFLGFDGTTGRYFNGLIDDVRVYDEALTLTQLDAIRDAMSVAPPPPLLWNNDSGNGLWDAISLNWDDGLTNVAFANGEEVLFEDTLDAVEEIQVVGTVEPGKITFATVFTDYEFDGAGTIGGSGPMLVSNGGWVNFRNSGGLSFSGPLQIAGFSRVILETAGNHGSTSIAAGSALELLDGSSLAGPVQNNGTLLNDSTTGTQTISGVISGNGAIQHFGEGTFLLDAVNTHTGTVSINSGVLRLAQGAKLYQTGAFFGVQNQNYIIINTDGTFETWNWDFGDENSLSRLRNNYGQILLNGGTVRFTESFSSPRAFTVGANGGSIEAGAGITYTKPAGTIADENIIRFSANSTLTIGGDGDVLIGDALGSYGSSGFSITKTGTGTLTLSGSNSYTGNTTVTAGSFVLESTGALTFAPGADGQSNQISGSGDATYNGRFIFDLSSADAIPGNTWIIAAVADQSFDAATFSVSDGSTVFSENSPGIHTFDDGTSVWTFTESNGTLSVAATPVVGYSAWAASNAPTGTPADDFDGDGVPNAIEWVLGGSKDTNDLDKLPQPAIDGGNFVFSFVRNDDAWASGDTTVTIEVGTDLATWPDSYAVPQALGVHGPVTVAEDGGVITVTLTLPTTPDARKFARLLVTITP